MYGSAKQVTHFNHKPLLQKDAAAAQADEIGSDRCFLVVVH